jgi:hypothetical protein
MKTVYIASPYTLDDVAVNVRNSFLVADELVELGFIKTIRDLFLIFYRSFSCSSLFKISANNTSVTSGG